MMHCSEFCLGTPTNGFPRRWGCSPQTSFYAIAMLLACTVQKTSLSIGYKTRKRATSQAIWPTELEEVVSILPCHSPSLESLS